MLSMLEGTESDHYITITRKKLTKKRLNKYINPFFKWEEMFPVITHEKTMHQNLMSADFISNSSKYRTKNSKFKIPDMTNEQAKKDPRFHYRNRGFLTPISKRRNNQVHLVHSDETLFQMYTLLKQETSCYHH